MDLVGVTVNGNVNFAPGSAFAHAVLFNFPFAFAEDFQPSRIDEKMERLPMIIDLDRNVERFGPFTYRSVVRSPQLCNPKHCKKTLTKPSKTSYQISGLQSGREYAITLCANGDESVVPSQPAEVFVRTNEKLDKPTVLYSHSEGYNVSTITLKKITLVWNPVYGASGYMVEFGVQGETSTETRRVSGGSSSSYTIDELSPTGYRMRVKALYDADSNADSDFSDWITL